MPLPEPREDETQEGFMERCTDNDVVNREFDTDEQIRAVCLVQWEEANK